MPQALPVIGLVTSVVGAVGGAYSSYQQGMAQQQAAKQQANMAMMQGAMENDQAQFNATVATMDAEKAEEEGREAKKEGYDNAQRKRLEAAKVIGQQRAEAGASGAQVDQGNFLDQRLDTAEKGEVDALAINEQGLWADYNKRLEGASHRAQATGLAGSGAMALKQADLKVSMQRNKPKEQVSWLSGGSKLVKNVQSYWGNQ